MGLLLAAPLLGGGALASGGLSTVATVAGIAGAGISALGALQQGQALSAEATYQSQVAANNAKIAGQYAEQATQTGEQQAFIQGLKERQRYQQVTAGIAASGVNVNTGSAADVRRSQRELGALDVEQVRQSAALQAYGYRTQQTSYQAESKLLGAESGFDTTAGFLGAGGALLSGAAYWGNFGGASSGLTGLFNNQPSPNTLLNAPATGSATVTNRSTTPITF